VDDHTEIGYRTLPPHDYFTQFLANGKVRLFALEEVITDYDDFENLRAVATLDWDDGLELCDFLKDVMDEIDEETGRLERDVTPNSAPASAARRSPAARARAVQQLMAPGKKWPSLETVIAFSRSLPTAVTTAVLTDLARQGIDVAAVAVSPPSSSGSDSVGE
jgi:hypothetical protein